MLGSKLVKKALDLLLRSGGDFSEVFIQKRSLNNLRIEDGKIEKSTSGYELGCGLRLIYKESTFYAYIDSLEEDKILNASKVLSSAINENRNLKVLDLNERKSTYIAPVYKYPSEVSQGEKRECLLKADETARAYADSIIQVTASLSDLEESTFVANSHGFSSNENTVKVFIAINTVAKKGPEIRTGYRSAAKTKGYELLDNNSVKKHAADAAKTAVLMLDAVNAPIGRLQVVLGPAFGGVIFHEACGHGLEADAIVKDASVYRDKLGKKIASESITAVDDATMPYHWGSYSFDGEGFPSGKNVLIEDGVLVNYIYDLRSAKKLNSRQTGNGRRQSYRDIPLPRMSNTYICNGKEKPQSIIQSVKKGVYAKEFAGGQVDPATGDFVFGISEGYIIENGQISTPIKGATLIGNGPEILNKIEAVGDNLDFAPGFCGKGGQSISNEVGQPTLLVSDITVGGTKD